MHIIYQCYGSAHSSVIAAAIHLGKLPSDRLPSVKEVLELPDFDWAEDRTIGTLFYKGRDENGHAVYTLGLGREWRAALRCIRSMLEILGEDPLQYRLVHALDCITLTTKVGGALSRRYGLCFLGRPLAAWGIRKSYPRLLELVCSIKGK
ncbi:uncharacterized protein DUF3189 [Melghirimyces profundicolus]|uniref:Uncharacterized protein DUF3189 n=1 Tax=Melghirimyces profundicolus TaxID=1242148 RepID=A0A2T6C9H1_9BACL|nr:DUF3189 family protein [Melghirimyces profundicolus]PTX64978.1 uncharacterized protein DUF3189 [Melghirimyces profundicolus]